MLVESGGKIHEEWYLKQLTTAVKLQAVALSCPMVTNKRLIREKVLMEY